MQRLFYPSTLNHRPPFSSRQQQGVVLVVVLIALVVLIIGAIALIRSFDTSLLQAGQLAFKRDLSNQGERGLAAAEQALRSGTLATESARQDSNKAENYSSTPLAINAHGVPLALLNNDDFKKVGSATKDLGGDDDKLGAGVTIRYVIDRQCRSTGTFDELKCVSYQDPKAASLGGSEGPKPYGDTYPVYRITVRVTGPRNTTTYLQRMVAL